MLLLNIVLEVLARAIRQEKRNQSCPKLLEIIEEYIKVTGYKISIQKSVAFIYTNKKL